MPTTRRRGVWRLHRAANTLGRMYTFVTGGYRSGRSNYALHRAAELGPPPWLYVSAGQETDEAVRKRIQHHRRDAEAIWRTGVIPPRLMDLIEPPALEGCG